jgi:phosphoribosyl 1,2-cyclic phosphate phosphodiesterase
MELTLLGTAAAEGLPAAYCDCTTCTEARRRGGPNIRTRSGAIIDDDLKIDHGPDTIIHAQRLGRSFGKVRTILFTHQHGDHLLVDDLKRSAAPSTTTRDDRVITIYGNEIVLGRIREWFGEHLAKLRLELQQLSPFEPVTTPMQDRILPLAAAHAPGSLMLRITRAGRNILYGHDSGIYPQETLDALGDGLPLDVALFDCTHGNQPSPSQHHLNIDNMLRMTDELRSRGAIVDRTRLIATHFSHNGRMLHEDLLAALRPHGFDVAFDGMVVRL